MTTDSCPKCGSTVVIPNVRLLDHGESHVAFDLSAAVYTKPEAWVFKGAVSQKFRARVCGGCGYTEFYLDDPQALLAAVRRAESEA